MARNDPRKVLHLKARAAAPTGGLTRGRWLLVAVASLAVIAGVSGFFLWHRIPTPPVPVIKLEGADPAIAKAIQEARQTVLRSPRSGPAWGHLAMELCIHDFVADSDGCFAQAQRFDPLEPRWPYLRGLARSGDSSEAALPHFRRAAELCDLPAPHLRLAEVLIERGQIEEAKTHVVRVLDRNPQDGRALLAMGRIAFSQGKLPESLDFLSRSVKSAPDVKAAQALLATVEQRLGHGAEAEAALRRASTLPESPVWPDPFLIELNRLRTGLDAAINLAEDRLKRGAVLPAVELMEKTARDYPNRMGAWLTLGKAQVAATNLPAAERALRQAVELEPGSCQARLVLGNALFVQEKFSEAEANYREAIRLKPNLAEAWFDLGLCLMNQRKTEESLEAFQSAARFKPDLTYAYIRWGHALARLERFPEAIAQIKRALELSPTNQEAQAMLRTLEEKLKR